MPDKNKNKGGRPEGKNNKSHVIATRLNDAQYADYLARMAHAGHKTTGAFLEELATKGKATPRTTQKRINKGFYVELSRIRSNLSQAAECSNIPVDLDSVRSVGRDLNDAVKSARINKTAVDPDVIQAVIAVIDELRKEVISDC